MLTPPTDTRLNAIIYVDYENIFELLTRHYHKDPMEIDFFKVITERFKSQGANIIDFIVYGNFERNSTYAKLLTHLRVKGIQGKQASNNGKNSSDLELTVDALHALYRKPHINLFILVSSDRDIIPLLKAVKYENKLTYVLSTKNGFNQSVANYADFHEYLEEIFGLTPVEAKPPQQEELELTYDPATVTPLQVERAKEVARRLYGSNIWKKSSQFGEPVSLTGYIQVLQKALERVASDILNDFKLAHCMKYVTIYTGEDQRLYIKEGEEREECLEPEPKESVTVVANCGE